MLLRANKYLQQHPLLVLVLALLWSGLIFYGCSLPGKELPKLNLFDQVDKVIHFTFFLLFFFLWYAVKPKPWLWLVIAFGYGFGIEFYQHYLVKGRSFDVWDGVADTAGALVMWFLLKKSNSTPQSNPTSDSVA
jgi:hypothetical protein